MKEVTINLDEVSERIEEKLKEIVRDFTGGNYTMGKDQQIREVIKQVLESVGQEFYINAISTVFWDQVFSTINTKANQ